MNILSYIEKKVIIDAPIKTIYELWTTRAGVNRFFAADSRIELEPNGAYEIYFDLTQPYGTRGSEGCKVIRFIENEYLEFTWNVPPSFKKEREQNYQSIVKIEMTSINHNKTNVTLRNEYHKQTEQLDEINKYFDRAWDYVLNNLVEYLKK